MYHDLQQDYDAPSSAIAFPEELCPCFSSMVLGRATSIIFRETGRVRKTIIPVFKDRVKPIPELSFYAGMEAYGKPYHVLLRPAEGKKDDWNFALSEDGTTDFQLSRQGVATFVKIIPIPSGRVRKAFLYCLLSSFLQLSLDPDLKASLKGRYPEQYTHFLKCQ
jgi:hypothetical protein